MRRIRVLIVDDSSVVRRLLTEILNADPAVEVVGVAPDATVALAKISQLAPDVITLDVEMPDVSGLDLLTLIRKADARVPIIMFSSLTQRAAATTLDALARGATDYVTKPASTGSREASAAHVREQLLPKIKALGSVARPTGTVAVLQRPAAPAPARPRVTPDPIEVLAIGCSTGGPNALSDVFAALPGNLPVPTVIVQHMPPLFTRLLAERLDTKGPLRFREAKHGDVLAPGHVWIAPGDYHMRVERSGTQKSIALDLGPQENSCRPAVDVLFRSVAETYGGKTLAVVLTGMGQDGLKGVEKLHAAGAQIIVQDEATSVVWGMPGFIARAGLADKVLPLSQIAEEIRKRIMGTPASNRIEGAASWR